MLESRSRIFYEAKNILSSVCAWAAYLASIAFASTELFARLPGGGYCLDFGALVLSTTILAVLTISHHAIPNWLRSRTPVYSNVPRRDQWLRQIYPLLFDLAAIFLLHGLVAGRMLAPLFYVSYFIIAFALILTLSYVFAKTLHPFLASPKWRKNILIVGINEKAFEFFRYAMNNYSLGYNIIGFLGDMPFLGNRSNNIIGRLEDFKEVARQNVIDVAVVLLPLRTHAREIMALIRDAEEQGIALEITPEVLQIKERRPYSASLGGSPSLLVRSESNSMLKLGLKRLFDILFSFLALVLLSPILALATILIKLEDKGPVFYVQQRVGYHKRRFNLYKFRTMVVDAESRQASLEDQNEMDGPVFKIKDDPRVTRCGRIFRKYGIDELPQFYNALIGDMSIVGPRPLALRDYDGFSEDWLRKRFSVRPGITCRWQIMPNRNDLTFEEWMRLDMEYIDDWSLLEDLKIVLATIPAVLHGSGR